MGNLDGLGGHMYYASGRVYGVVIRIQRRLYVVGMCRRGVFWRFGASIFNPVRQYWESTFGLRTRIKLIETFLEVGMRNETIPIHFRPGGISGSLHFSRTGIITFVITSLDTSNFNQSSEQARKSLAAAKDKFCRDYDSIKEWY